MKISTNKKTHSTKIKSYAIRNTFESIDHKRCSFDFRSDKFGVFDLAMTMANGHGHGSLHIYTQHTVCRAQSLACVEMS